MDSNGHSNLIDKNGKIIFNENFFDIGDVDKDGRVPVEKNGYGTSERFWIKNTANVHTGKVEGEWKDHNDFS